MVESTNNKANHSDGSDNEFFDACDDMETGKSQSPVSARELLIFLSACAIPVVGERVSHFCFILYSNSSQHYIMTGKFPHS